MEQDSNVLLQRFLALIGHIIVMSRKRYSMSVAILLAALPLLVSCGQDASEQLESWQREKRSAFQAFRDRKYDVSIDTYKRAIALAQKIKPDGAEVASTYNDLAAVYSARGDDAQAGSCFENAINALSEHERQKNLDQDSMRALCDALAGLGTIKRKAGDPEGAVNFYSRAIRYTARCNTVSKQRQLVYEYKSVLHELGHDDVAAVLDRDFSHLADAAALPNAEDQARDEANKHIREGERALLAQDSEKAAHEYREALRYALQSSDLKFKGGVQSKVALYLFKSGHMQEAESFTLEAMRQYKAAGCGGQEMIPLLMQLCSVQMGCGKLKEAETTAKYALKLTEAAHGKNTLPYASSLSGLVAVYTTGRDYAKAIPRYEEAYAIYKKHYSNTSPTVVMETCWLSNIVWLNGEHDKCRAFIDKFVASLKKEPAPDLVVAARLLNDFGSECIKQSQPDEAKIFFNASLKLLNPREPGARLEIERAQAQLKAVGAAG